MQQLDIFADSAPVCRANELVAALARFDQGAVRSALAALEAIDPTRAGLSDFRMLCECVEGWPAECAALSRPGAGEGVLAMVCSVVRRIVPASAAMGKEAASLLRRIWRDLARASEMAGVKPEARDGFAAELYLRAGEHGEAVRTARGVPGADRRATVQRWLALGHLGTGENAAARAAALRYAWLVPERFGLLVAEMGDPPLTRDWRAFQADLGDLDATWFPAWCVHEKVAGAASLDNLPPGEGAAAYRLVSGLLIRERGGLCPAVYEDRARLKRLNDSFFAFYLRHRADPRAQRG